MQTRHIAERPADYHDPDEEAPVKASLLCAIRLFYDRYYQFSGRSSRSEYWWIFSLLVTITTGYSALTALFGGGRPALITTQDAAQLNAFGSSLSFVFLVVLLISAIPFVALTVRRLHDGNSSGWWALLLLFTTPGWVALAVFALRPSRPDGARFDKPPAPEPTF
ncbi:DUF805 domain-containing protein [Kocuria coralli]|nr:DUF805 domain-containing protein [Kocuria coralli]